MRKFLIAAAAISSLAFAGMNLQAEDKAAKGEGWNGVLIDANCGAKQKTEADAAGHPKACAMKEGCAKSGYGIVKGDKFIKFDKKGNDLAKEYLAVEENETAVHVEGELDKEGKEIKVSAIHKADKEKAEKKG